MTYTEFKKLKINTSSIGWEPASSDDVYFCTPKGAKIIGRAGVDGIHYCTVRKLGETIFAVSPMNLPGKYVHPIARNMEDLLRLLLACCDMNIIEQAWMWDEEQLAEQIGAVKKSEYFDPSALDAIREKCGLTPLENPYEYLYRLQKSYNYAQIPFTDEYYEMMEENAAWQPPSEWKVTMDGDFTPERGKGGKEIPLGKTFRWGRETWHIPSAYLCSRGIVVDFFAEINDASSDTPSNRVLHFIPTLVVNGCELKNKSGRGDAWFPNEYPDGGEENPIAKWVLTHYGFDLSRTWIIRRCTFPSETKISEITSLSLKMERGREQFLGIRFSSPQVGDAFTFKHPTVGTEHTLTVQEYEPHEMDFRENDEWIFPTHCMLMRYTVTPEIPMDEMGVRDIRGGDAPRRNPSASVRAGDDFCSVIGVIRSSDGPTAVFVGAGSTAQVRSACSSLRFEKPERVDWCIEFRVKTVEDIEIELIPQGELQMNYRNDRYGNPLSILGFGCMRFPQKLGRIDMTETEAEIMTAFQSGVNYYDTAYIYPGSEAALGEILEKNQIRDQVHIATKLPHYLIKSANELDKLFSEQLRRLRTDYVDYYLMHMLPDTGAWDRLKKLGIVEWIERMKASGAIRQIGFSYHGNAEVFCDLVDAYDWDFCQIQYNYMDEHSQAGRKGLHHAHAKGLSVIIMEPLRGGKLVSRLPEEAKKVFAEYKTAHTPAQWAFRWLWNQPEVTVVLSGMNSDEMVRDNISTASSVKIGELNSEDEAMLQQVVKAINAKMKVGCTGCGYCMPCPRGVDIPGTFAAYNRRYSEGRFAALVDYTICTALRGKSTAASNCISCGKCEQHCPQNIEIRRQLKDAQKVLETPVYRIARKVTGWFMHY